MVGRTTRERHVVDIVTSTLYRGQGLGFRGWGSRVGVQRMGFRRQGLGFRVQVLEFGVGVQGLAFRGER